MPVMTEEEKALRKAEEKASKKEILASLCRTSRLIGEIAKLLELHASEFGDGYVKNQSQLLNSISINIKLWAEEEMKGELCQDT